MTNPQADERERRDDNCVQKSGGSQARDICLTC
jgi:hypothetical protein